MLNASLFTILYSLFTSAKRAQQPRFPLVPLFLEPEVPGSWIGRNLLRTRHRIIRCPSGSRWYHVVVIAKREPALLVVVNQSCKIHTVIITAGLHLIIIHFYLFTIHSIEVVRPSAGNALQRGSRLSKPAVARLRKPP